MKPFSYYNPVRVLFGSKQKYIANILKADGHSKILLVYGKNSIKKSGLYDEICRALKEADIKFIEHSGVNSNPILSHAREGAQKAKCVTAVLAVGGGSVIDESKAIAAATASECDVWELYKNKRPTDALDLYVILTLSATGSEMNSGSVLTNEETKEKLSFNSPLIYPRVSIVNPSFTTTLPKEYLSYSAVDIITHVLEVYFTAEEHPQIQNRFCENIIKSTIKTTNELLKNPNDIEARGEFALCATWALNGLTSLGVGEYSFPNHMIEHSLSAIYNVPHGAGLSVVLPAWLKWFYEETKNPQVVRFSKKIFLKKSAKEGISALKEWLKKIDAPITLKELGIKSEDVDKIAKNVDLVSSKWGLKEKYPYETVKKILNLAK
ncbi:MAG: iron-containing alcohol dehydrogenase [Campylobacteraceae bacterium]|jgi:alcohol dehydrogenase YqhD (iron-dependent ADH family)|nr:iron-containing alcohol dehydrogenase [Campylobacteraceae bacterium]